MHPNGTKYSTVDGDSDSPRDSISLSQMEKQSFLDRMRVRTWKKHEKASVVFQLSAPWIISVVLALTNLMLLAAFLNQQRPHEVRPYKSWMPPESKFFEVIILSNKYSRNVAQLRELLFSSLTLCMESA